MKNANRIQIRRGKVDKESDSFIEECRAMKNYDQHIMTYRDSTKLK